MKTKVAALIAVAITVVSICLSQSTGNLPKPPETLQEIRADLKQTQTQVQQLAARVAALEKQVSALDQANARLQKELMNLKTPRLVPLDAK